MLSSFDILLLSLAVFFLFVGIKRRLSLLEIGKRQRKRGDIGAVISYLGGHKKILERRWIGTAHWLLFWGLVVTLILTIYSQVGVTTSGLVAGGMSLIRDIAGVCMLAGVVFFIVRRLIDRGPEPQQWSILPLSILLIILIAGFLAEGTRLRIIPSEPIWWSPAGWAISKLCSDSPLFMKLMIRTHIFGVAVFIALIPFTFLRHIHSTLLNLYYHDKSSLTDTSLQQLGEHPLGAKDISDFSWKQLLNVEACVSCSRCQQNCPAFLSEKPLSPQKIIRNILEDMEETARVAGRTNRSGFFLLQRDISEDEVWSCTTCGACNDTCPAGVDVIDKIMFMRQYEVEQGTSPALCHSALEGISSLGNPWLHPQWQRSSWVMGHDRRTVNHGEASEWLYWVGCTGSYITSAQEVARAVYRLLRKGGIHYRLLGTRERCCGEPARRLGEEGLFQRMARENIDLFHLLGIKKIVTFCPHCYHVFRDEYSQIEGGNFEVYHYTEICMSLAREKPLRIASNLGSKKIFFQDPCYLTRYHHKSDIFRYILQDVLKANLLNPASNKYLFCCGGGGGQIWLDIRGGNRIENIRLSQINQFGPDLIVTACPFCKIMLNSGTSSLNLIGQFNIRDISELLAEYE